jgi:hypothetical protein
MCGSLWLDEAPLAAHLADLSDASDITQERERRIAFEVRSPKERQGQKKTYPNA